MLANVWHFWIGVVLVLVAVAGVAGLGFAYLKSVSSQRYPHGRQERQLDL